MMNRPSVDTDHRPIRLSGLVERHEAIALFGATYLHGGMPRDAVVEVLGRHARDPDPGLGRKCFQSREAAVAHVRELAKSDARAEIDRIDAASAPMGDRVGLWMARNWPSFRGRQVAALATEAIRDKRRRECMSIVRDGFSPRVVLVPDGVRFPRMVEIGDPVWVLDLTRFPIEPVGLRPDVVVGRSVVNVVDHPYFDALLRYDLAETAGLFALDSPDPETSQLTGTDEGVRVYLSEEDGRREIARLADTLSAAFGEHVSIAAAPAARSRLLPAPGPSDGLGAHGVSALLAFRSDTEGLVEPSHGQDVVGVGGADSDPSAMAEPVATARKAGSPGNGASTSGETGHEAPMAGPVEATPSIVAPTQVHSLATSAGFDGERPDPAPGERDDDRGSVLVDADVSGNGGSPSRPAPGLTGNEGAHPQGSEWDGTADGQGLDASGDGRGQRSLIPDDASGEPSDEGGDDVRLLPEVLTAIRDVDVDAALRAMAVLVPLVRLPVAPLVDLAPVVSIADPSRAWPDPTDDTSAFSSTDGTERERSSLLATTLDQVGDGPDGFREHARREGADTVPRDEGPDSPVDGDPHVHDGIDEANEPGQADDDVHGRMAPVAPVLAFHDDTRPPDPSHVAMPIHDVAHLLGDPPGCFGILGHGAPVDVLPRAWLDAVASSLVRHEAGPAATPSPEPRGVVADASDGGHGGAWGLPRAHALQDGDVDVPPGDPEGDRATSAPAVVGVTWSVHGELEDGVPPAPMTETRPALDPTVGETTFDLPYEVAAADDPGVIEGDVEGGPPTSPRVSEDDAATSGMDTLEMDVASLAASSVTVHKPDVHGGVVGAGVPATSVVVVEDRGGDLGDRYDLIHVPAYFERAVRLYRPSHVTPSNSLAVRVDAWLRASRGA